MAIAHVEHHNLRLRNFFYATVITASLLLIGFWFRLQQLPVKDSDLHFMFNVGIAGLYAIGTLIGSVLIVSEDNRSKQLFFFSMTLSLLFSAIALAMWSYYNLVLRIPSPYPSFADLFFLAYTGLLSVSFWYYFDLLNIDLKMHNLLEAIFIILITYVVMFFLLFEPDYSRDMTVVEIITNYLYPLADAVALSVALVVIRTTGVRNLGILFIFSSILFLIAGDVLFSMRSTANTYWNGDVTDLMYLCSAIFQILGLIFVFFEKEKHYQLHKNT